MPVSTIKHVPTPRGFTTVWTSLEMSKMPVSQGTPGTILAHTPACLPGDPILAKTRLVSQVLQADLRTTLLATPRGARLEIKAKAPHKTVPNNVFEEEEKLVKETTNEMAVQQSSVNQFSEHSCKRSSEQTSAEQSSAKQSSAEQSSVEPMEKTVAETAKETANQLSTHSSKHPPIEQALGERETPLAKLEGETPLAKLEGETPSHTKTEGETSPEQSSDQPSVDQTPLEE